MSELTEGQIEQVQWIVRAEIDGAFTRVMRRISDTPLPVSDQVQQEISKVLDVLAPEITDELDI